MTLIEAAKQALEALERYAPQHGNPDDMIDAITALRTAIEQAENLRDENERLHVENRRLIDRIEVMGVPVGVGGYLTTTTTPPAAQPAPEQYTALEQALTRLQKRYCELHSNVAAQRQWVGLTDDDFQSICANFRVSHGGWVDMLVLQIEAKLKEKNT